MNRAIESGEIIIYPLNPAYPEDKLVVIEPLTNLVAKDSATDAIKRLARLNRAACTFIRRANEPVTPLKSKRVETIANILLSFASESIPEGLENDSRESTICLQTAHRSMTTLARNTFWSTCISLAEAITALEEISPNHQDLTRKKSYDISGVLLTNSIFAKV